MPFTMVLTSLWVYYWSVSIQMNATMQYIPEVLFILLYNVALALGFVDKILKCDHSNESYWAVLSI